VTPADLSAALVPVLDALARLGVRHFVAGSIASSAHGVPRASIDADVVAELAPVHAPALIAALADAYYIPQQRLVDAIQQRSSFSVIHLETMVKVDVFVANGVSDQRALGRIQLARLEGGVEMPVGSAEDTVLAKLEWFRRGGEVSERQWTDVLGLLRVAGPLDMEYLLEGARDRRVSDLLDRATAEAKGPGQ
jgi:hypothetical protein